MDRLWVAGLRLCHRLLSLPKTYACPVAGFHNLLYPNPNPPRHPSVVVVTERHPTGLTFKSRLYTLADHGKVLRRPVEDLNESVLRREIKGEMFQRARIALTTAVLVGPEAVH